MARIVFFPASGTRGKATQITRNAVWQTDDNDPQGEINASVRLPDGTIMWPMQRVMKRFQNGSEDSIYVYGHSVTKELTNELFDQSYWQIDKEKAKPNKPWWKFW